MSGKKDSNREKGNSKSQKKGSMTVEEAGRLGGQRVKELIEEGKKAKRKE
jgi:Small, acid-soluble spore proteins, alpha/beta type